MKISDLKKIIKQRNPDIESLTQKDIGYQIGKQIELARALKNLTQIELATKIGTRQSSISRIESGSSLPTISFLMKIAEAFNTYLIPPKFAFMENIKNETINYTAESSADTSHSTPSPFQFHFTTGNFSESKHNRIIMG